MKQLLIIIYLLPLSTFLLAQEAQKSITTDTLHEAEKTIYREVGGLGIGIIRFRDYATSPLIYEGIGLNLSRAKVKIDPKKEIRSSINFTIGNTFNSVVQPQSDIERERHLSSVNAFDLRYSRLYTLGRNSRTNTAFKIGGAFDLQTIVRINPSLGNNGRGIDIFPTVFASFKMVQRQFAPILLRKNKPPRKQDFAIRLDVGLLNANVRNGYAYTIHAPFYNDGNPFDGYAINWFSGFRIGGTFDYVLYSKSNKNAVKFSYKVDAMRTGQENDRFSYFSSSYQFTYLHRLN